MIVSKFLLRFLESLKHNSQVKLGYSTAHAAQSSPAPIDRLTTISTVNIPPPSSKLTTQPL